MAFFSFVLLCHNGNAKHLLSVQRKDTLRSPNREEMTNIQNNSSTVSGIKLGQRSTKVSCKTSSHI